ncbi:putative secreted protein [Micromonospora sp. Llam0]|uniref:phage tail tube protein n=1 Tax=Micromonospora sp. Llam0 TaxID=2485143 RepID=UPI000F4878F1|nr:phage tail tube protein [Micromonospora sp. Llam0]ROO51465.1 putative secreted protein [Micromonospora sp. Llam0]
MSGVDAFGTQFKRGDGATPTEAFAAIANVTSISGPARSRETIDVTAHDSPGGWMQFVGSLKDGGEVSLEINYDPTETTHDLDDDFDDVDPRNYQIVILPDTADEHTWDFAAILTELGDEFPYDDKMGRSLTVKISGKPTLTPTGS